MRFKSADFAGQNISWGTCYSSLLLIYLWQGLFWVIILHEYKSLTHKPRSRWDGVMLQYAVIAGLIQFVLYLVQISDFAIGKRPLPLHNRNTPMLYRYCDTKGGISFTNSLPQIDPPIRPKDFEHRFVSRKDLFLCSIV